ncbi:MAG: hypothetical protein ACR2JF_00540 [Iamia sp.]
MSPPAPDFRAVIESLPRDHLALLRAALAGAPVADLAAQTGVPLEAVLPLLRVATAKLERALADATDGVVPGSLLGGP